MKTFYVIAGAMVILLLASACDGPANITGNIIGQIDAVNETDNAPNTTSNVSDENETAPPFLPVTPEEMENATDDIPVQIPEQVNNETTEPIVPDEEEYYAILSPMNEVPPATSDASGEAYAFLDGNTLIVTGNFEGLATPATSAHVHWAAVGFNGPVLFPLTLSAPNETSSEFSGSMALDELQLLQLEYGFLYVNVHSEEYPEGEIRGHLLVEGAPGLEEPNETATTPVLVNETDFETVNESVAVNESETLNETNASLSEYEDLPEIGG